MEVSKASLFASIRQLHITVTREPIPLEAPEVTHAHSFGMSLGGQVGVEAKTLRLICTGATLGSLWLGPLITTRDGSWTERFHPGIQYEILD